MHVGRQIIARKKSVPKRLIEASRITNQGKIQTHNFSLGMLELALM